MLVVEKGYDPLKGLLSKRVRKEALKSV